MDKGLKLSLLNSYLIGLPFGLGIIAFTIFFPSMFSGEGLLTLIMLTTFARAIAGLVISFVLSLWVGAIVAKKSINNEDKLLLTSFKYSASINLIIWIVFGIIAALSPENEWKVGLIAVIAFVICTLLTTFTIGLLISYRIRTGIKKYSS
ncbi:hypothetical protein JQC67_12470 [Aurantibacter crassamenti]|uniref:hypothetical protein n=1 Tax=Aurantibacter crassamenti TaxID=1837375 RepID=UPI001939DB00|nr:hypothetical protein [Aurantibacter crassamenti]MBM1106957.1 hypothetical protein [Aurantibacter crassamenti]